MTDQTVTQDTLEEALAAASLDPGDEHPPDDVEEADPGTATTGEAPESHAPPGAPAPAPGTVDIPGVGTFTVDQLGPVARAAQWAAQNPDAWAEVVADYERRTAGAPAPRAQEAEPPDADEWVDPDVAALRSEIADLRDTMQSRHTRDVMRAVSRAADRFREAHADVDEPLMTRLWEHLRDLDVLDRYVDRADDEFAGTLAALEDAYRVVAWDHAREADRRDMLATMRERRTGAAATSRARPSDRTEQVPADPQERNQALVRELRNAMNEHATQ